MVAARLNAIELLIAQEMCPALIPYECARQVEKLRSQMEELRSSIDLSSYIAPLSARRGVLAGLSPCVSEAGMSPCPDVPSSEGKQKGAPTILYSDPLAACEAVHSKEVRQAEELLAAQKEVAALRESLMEAAEGHEKRVCVARAADCGSFGNALSALFEIFLS
jgi:hypothetical protein